MRKRLGKGRTGGGRPAAQGTTTATQGHHRADTATNVYTSVHCSKGCALLLSTGLEAAGAAAAPPAGISVDTGSATAAEVAMLARPRYHVAGGQDDAFARLPYANRDLGVGIRVTRFVALAPIAGESNGSALLGDVPHCNTHALLPVSHCRTNVRMHV